jgi:hypothetical protein
MARWAIINNSEQVVDYRTTGGDFVYDPNEYGNLASGRPVMRPLEIDPEPSYNPATHEINPTPIVEVLANKVLWHWQTVPRDPAAIANEQRIAAYIANTDRADLVNRLKTASVAQLETYIDSNVTLTGSTVAALRSELQTLLRAILKRIVKVLVTNVKQ